MPYSPLGRGFLTGAITSVDDLPEDDFRRRTPRFAEEALAANLAIVDTVRSIADAKGATPAQVALAWVLAQGDDVVPIPGTKRVRYLEENVGALDVVALRGRPGAADDALPSAVGARYPDMSSIDR